jgi:hypothetical protein
MGAAPNLYGISIGNNEALAPIRSAFKEAGVEFATGVPADLTLVTDRTMSLVIGSKKPEFWRSNAN